jgi:hypothetical protein
MPSTSVVMDVRVMPDANSTDRRADQRYPIALQLQYRLMRKGRVQRRGFGRTLNISSHGVLFEIDGVVPTSGQMELALNWPFLLQGSCGLQLVMRGRILRTHKTTLALKAEFHEFRTVRRGLFEKPEFIH